MNPNEPSGKDVLEAGFKALFGPVQDLFLKLTGPGFEEYGLMWQDSVRLRRARRLVKGLVKAKAMIEEAGFSPNVVPDKLLLPIFEGMSVEEDETLHTMWAALLANTADPGHPDKIHPLFPSILGQLTPLEAHLLRDLFGSGAGTAIITTQLPPPLGAGNLVRHGLVNNLDTHILGIRECTVTLTSLGTSFVSACASPNRQVPSRAPSIRPG